MLPRKKRLADNDVRRQTESHGENLDESAEQEDPEKALVQRRSATRAVMQSKFTGAFLDRGAALEK